MDLHLPSQEKVDEVDAVDGIYVFATESNLEVKSERLHLSHPFVVYAVEALFLL